MCQKVRKKIEKFSNPSKTDPTTIMQDWIDPDNINKIHWKIKINNLAIFSSIKCISNKKIDPRTIKPSITKIISILRAWKSYKKKSKHNQRRTKKTKSWHRNNSVWIAIVSESNELYRLVNWFQLVLAFDIHTRLSRGIGSRRHKNSRRFH